MKTAALLIIGNEILSGRTQDANLAYLADTLAKCGIELSEARVVRDIESQIVEAVNALRSTYDYVFTTGGIGPTHDDITIASIAKAFGVAVVESEEAFAALVRNYGGEEHVTPARRRMALVPKGAELIDNPVSGAPGVRIGNVHILAGVPKIMQGMLNSVLPTLEQGTPLLTETIIVDIAESLIADDLAAIQAKFPDIEIGSYPRYSPGQPSVALVARGSDAGRMSKVKEALESLKY